MKRSENRAIQRELDAQVTVRLMEKEMSRFDKMNADQLKARLFKITNPVKLEAFRQMARTYGLRGLVKLAAEKRNFFMEAN